jgi:hypothetical protein
VHALASEMVNQSAAGDSASPHPSCIGQEPWHCTVLRTVQFIPELF